MSKKLSSLEKLIEQRKAIETRIKAEEKKQKQIEVKNKQRIKLLVGEYYLSLAEKEGKMEELNQHMATFLTNDTDRQLFGLSPINTNDQPDS